MPALLFAALVLPLGAASPALAARPELIPREALFGNPERAAVQLSPDGKTLSWVAPVKGVMNVWVAPASDPAKARPVTDDTSRGITQYFWTHRPDTLLYLRDNGGDEDYHVHAVDLASGKTRDLTPFPKTSAEINRVSRLHPDAVLIAMNDRDPKWHDLYRVDLASGARTLVMKNDQEIGGYLVDGDYAVRAAIKPRADGGTDILSPDGPGRWKKTGDIPFADSLTTQVLRYTVDGNTLYMLDSRGRNTAALYGIDSATGKKTLLSEDARADIGGTLADPMTGVAQAVSIDYLREEWKPLGGTLVADLETLKTLGPGSARVVSRTLDDAHWIIRYSAAETPSVYYRYDRDGSGAGKLTRLFSARPALDGKPLAPMWPVEIKTRDGMTMVSYLTLPVDADTNHDGKADHPVPMVLLPHGGPWGRDSYGYDAITQLLANRGYAVLQPNFRASTGFGKAFTNAGDGEWGAKMHDDLLDAVGWAVHERVTTPGNVAILGGSYGGYATLAGLTFTPDAFKCGVDLFGPSNLNTLLSTVPAYWASFYEQLAKRMGDPRTEAGKAWLHDRSPLTRADQISKPLLIGQGANDARVKQAEADQIIAAMQAKHIPVTYVLFPDEGHGFQRPENNKAFFAVAEVFLSQCLGGRAQSIGHDFAGSSISVPTGADAVKGVAEALKGNRQEVKN